MMSTTLQNYYNMMRGYGTMTDTMKEEFKQLIKLLEGVRNIKWSDIETVNHEECFYSLTCLSIPHLMDPLNNKVPIYTLHSTDDQNQNCTKDILNTTFNTSCTEKDNVCGTHNTTVTLKTDSNISFNDNTKEKIEINETIGSIEKENNSVNCTQPIVKKRVLSDKNNVNIIKTPIKQARRISPKHKDTSYMIQAKEKENKQKPHITMSAKSIAILNKLKADKLKKDNLDKENTDGTLKVVREKERRGLITTHPYQKPNSKQKFVPAPASSRMPW